MISTGLILAICLALIHGFVAELPIFSIIPRFRWISFAGGVSLSYVFLEIFPELSHAQEELQHSELELLKYLENHVYILAEQCNDFGSVGKSRHGSHGEHASVSTTEVMRTGNPAVW